MCSKEVDLDKKSDFQGQDHRHYEIKKKSFERIFNNFFYHIKVTSVFKSSHQLIQMQ